MKKIKGLLLFGILTLLGIGSSFGANISNVSYELGGYNRNYQFYVGNSSSQGGISYISGVLNNTPVFIELISKPYSLYSGDLLFDVLGTHTGKWSSAAYSPSFNLYYGNDFVSLFGKYNSTYGSIFNFNNSSNRSRSLYVNQIFGLRLFLSNNSSSIQCLFPDTSNSLTSGFFGGCDIENYQIFPYNLGYSINSISNSVYDSTYNSGTSILNSRKTAVFPGLGQGYSFIYEKISSHGGFRSVFSGTLVSEDFSTFNYNSYVQDKYIDGQLIFNVNNIADGGNQGQTTIIAIDSFTSLYYRYSLYNCSDTIISNCTFIQGGKLYSDSGLIVPSFYSDFDYFYSGLNYIDTGSYYYIPTIYTYYNSIDSTLTLTRYGYWYRSSSNSPLINFSKTINLVPGDGLDNYNLLEYLGIGGGIQSTGSIAINTGLLNLCLNDLQFGELNSFLCNQLLVNLGNPVLIPGYTGQYISVSIDENGNLRYWITTQEDLAEQMSGFIWVENDDGSWSTICPSGDCLGTVLAQPINHGNTGFELTTGDVLDMMSNLTGWVGRCPFPYTDFRLGKNLKLLQLLQDYGFNYDPFIIINCSVAGFQYGRHTIDNTLFGDTFEHPLLYGDTSKHRTLFVFLDFVVILGLFGLFAFIKKIF